MAPGSAENAEDARARERYENLERKEEERGDRLQDRWEQEQEEELQRMCWAGVGKGLEPGGKGPLRDGPGEAGKGLVPLQTGLEACSVAPGPGGVSEYQRVEAEVTVPAMEQVLPQATEAGTSPATGTVVTSATGSGPCRPRQGLELGGKGLLGQGRGDGGKGLAQGAERGRPRSRSRGAGRRHSPTRGLWR